MLALIESALGVDEVVSVANAARSDWHLERQPASRSAHNARSPVTRQCPKTGRNAVDTSSSTGHRNGADLVVWTAGNTRSLGPVPLHTSGRRFDTVRAPPLLRRLRSGPFRSLETLSSALGR